MKRDDRLLLSELAQVNTALPAFAMRVMSNTATSAEHQAIAERLVTLGQAIDDRARTLTIINTAADNATDIQNFAAARALSAVVDMADALDRTTGAASTGPDDTLSVDWSG
jgi:hypothetical protein